MSAHGICASRRCCSGCAGVSRLSVSAGVAFGPEQIQAVFWRDRRSQMPVQPARAPTNPHDAHLFQSRLSRSPPGTSGGRARGTGGSFPRKQECGSPARANSKPTERPANSGFTSLEPPQRPLPDLRRKRLARPLASTACSNEQPPARARVTLLHYALSVPSIELNILRVRQKI